MLKCDVGPPVSGSELFGRDVELEKIWNAVKAGSVLLISPRRFGKTSITFHMRDEPKPGYRVYYLDVEPLDNPKVLLTTILNKIKDHQNVPDKLWNTLSSSLKQIEEVSIEPVKLKLKKPIESDWMMMGNDIFNKISSESEYEHIFILDELPSMLLNMMKDPEENTKSELFLKWLRSVRNNFNIKFIICGSISMDQVVVDSNAVNTINDLERIMINPFTKEISKEMIENLFDGFNIETVECAPDMIYDKVGGIPFFIKLLVKYVAEEIQEQSVTLSPDVINDAYHKKVLGLHGREYFRHYFTRLDYYRELGFGIVAQIILDELAKREVIPLNELRQIFFNATKSNNADKFNDLIARLENDFYIIIDPVSKKCKFHTRVLMDLWKKRVI